MAFFSVTSSELRNRAGRITELNGQFKSKTTVLGEQESALCGMWEGEARDTFHQAFTRDKQQMDVFHQLIAQYVQALWRLRQDMSRQRRETGKLRRQEIIRRKIYLWKEF